MVRLLSVGVHGKFLRIPGLGCALPPAFKRPSAVIPQTCPSIQHCTLYLAVPRARWVAHFSHPSHPHAPPCRQPISGWFSKCQALAIPGPSTSRSSTPGNNRVWLEHSRTPRSNTARCSSVPWHTFPPLLGPRWPLLFTRGPRSSKPPSETAPPHPPQVSLRMPSLHVWSPGRHLAAVTPNRQTLVYLLSRSFAGLQISAQRKILLPRRISGLVKNNLGTCGSPPRSREHPLWREEVWPVIPALRYCTGHLLSEGFLAGLW